MSEHQTHLPLEATFSVAPESPPELRDEIASIWGLPLGKRVSASFGDRKLAGVAGVLELVTAAFHTAGHFFYIIFIPLQ